MKSKIIFFIFLSFTNVSNGEKVKARLKREIKKETDPLLSADLFEGDIAGVDSQTLSSAVNGTKFWTDKNIPYTIDNRVKPVAKRAIAKAIAEIEAKTCVRFRPATNQDQDLVNFISSKGCYSYVGKQGGKQEVSISGGCEQVGTITHLLMHVLGFWHEQSRLDRDLYVLINWDNIATENAKHFEKYSVPRINVQSAQDPSLSPYDFHSITHISPYAYAKSKTVPAILSKDERFKVGQRLELSQNDINSIVKAYCGQRQAQVQSDLLTAQEKVVLKKVSKQQKGEGSENDLFTPDQPDGLL